MMSRLVIIWIMALFVASCGTSKPSTSGAKSSDALSSKTSYQPTPTPVEDKLNDPTATMQDAGSQVVEVEDDDVGFRQTTSAQKAKMPLNDYRIQLGVFQNLNAAPNYNINNVSSRVDNNRLIYEISGFSSSEEAFAEAQQLQKYKKIKGAFVTRYIGGVRDYSFDYVREHINPNNSTYRATSPKSAASQPVESLYNSSNIDSKMIEVVDPAKKKSPSKIVIIDEE